MAKRAAVVELLFLNVTIILEVEFLLSLSIANTLARDGYSKQKIREYVYAHAKVPLRELEWMMTYGLVDVQTVRGKVEAGLYPREFLVGTGDWVRVVLHPDIIHIVVCGDPGRNRMKTLDSGYTRFTSRAIGLPAQWHAVSGAQNLSRFVRCVSVKA